MDKLKQDIQYSLRMLKKRPGFTTIAVIILALGIAANTTMFGLADLMLLRPDKVKNPEALIRCQMFNDRSIPYSTYCALRDNQPVFSDLMAQDGGMKLITLAHNDIARKVPACFVSSNYFSVLGTSLAQGRGFRPEEEQLDSVPVAVLSHRTWNRLGANPAMVGQFITLNGVRSQVVGVTPEGFTGATLVGSDIWLTLGSFLPVIRTPRGIEWSNKPHLNYPSVTPVGRLKPGLRLAPAQAQLQPLIPLLKESYPPKWTKDGGITLQQIPRMGVDIDLKGERIVLGITSLIFMSSSIAVLLIACLNLANMMIAQGATRQKEIAIRLALGAGRLRLIRQLLTESLLLALLGGALGLILTFWGTMILNHWFGGLESVELEIGEIQRIGVNWHILIAALGFSLLATLLFGLRPAVVLSRRDIVEELKESNRPLLGRRQGSLASFCQIVLAVVLVMGTVMFTRSTLLMARPHPALNWDNTLVIELDPQANDYDRTRRMQACKTLANHLESLPTIEALGTASSFCVGGGGQTRSVYEYTTAKNDGDKRRLAQYGDLSDVGNDYFAAVELPLLQGRPFNDLDGTPNAEKVVIIDESLSRTLRPDGKALGCWIQFETFREYSPPYKVVGIVPQIGNASGGKERRPQMYMPAQSDQLYRYLYLNIAGTHSPGLLKQRMAETMRRIEPRMPILSIGTLAQRRRNSGTVWSSQFMARVAGAAGTASLFLAALGIYAVKSHWVASRRRDIGIRKALGATHRDIMSSVLKKDLVLTLAGLGTGVLLGLGAARLMAGLFYGINTVDPLSIAVTVVLLGLISLLASTLPARRAARIDPMATLRSE